MKIYPFPNLAVTLIKIGDKDKHWTYRGSQLIGKDEKQQLCIDSFHKSANSQFLPSCGHSLLPKTNGLCLYFKWAQCGLVNSIIYKIMEGDSKTKQYTMQTYKGTHHIRYLQDFLCNNIRINYKACDLQSLNPNNVQVNEFGSLAEKLYKKYTRDRCIRKTNEVTKKSKKVDQNFYNSSDPWIDDGLVGEEKEAKESTYSDFKSVQLPLPEFYKSLDYKTEVVMEAKRKPEKIQIPEEERMMILGKLKNKQREEEQLRKQLPTQAQQPPPQAQAQAEAQRQADQ